MHRSHAYLYQILDTHSAHTMSLQARKQAVTLLGILAFTTVRLQELVVLDLLRSRHRHSYPRPAYGRQEKDVKCVFTHPKSRLWPRSAEAHPSRHVRTICRVSLPFLVANFTRDLPFRSAFDNYFLQAQQIRQLVRDDFERVLRHPSALSPPSKDTTSQGTGVDFLLCPTAIGTAPSLDDAKNMSELEVYLQDVLTVPTSLAGLPTLSVPVGLGDDGWLLGVSLTAQWGHDEAVLKLGEFVEGLVDAEL